MYVGSIKTIIGHSEGAAGLAGVLKASLALQHGIIPPNLLFNELSVTVQPFYSNLRVPRQSEIWPDKSGTNPRRASVNSFGFGGTNAHAILESFEPPSSESALVDSAPHMIPFNFSASSEKSLHGIAAAFMSYLEQSDDMSLRDLSWTLNTRRSVLPVRLSVPASTLHDLIQKLKPTHRISASMTMSRHESLDQSKLPKMLGIFTGQGAQWASMGRDLLENCAFARQRLAELQKSLDTLPVEHAPTWRMIEELCKASALSNMGQSEISQPLCTALQIIIVDLLKSAKVNFTTVVGHSSGEIAAGYACGYLSAKDAIRIAYYRGYFTGLAKGLEGTPGRMLAAGTSHEDATELCNLPSMAGRICVAAVNSPTSVTLSGDIDAIEDAREILEDEGKFARVLKVETAYHSFYVQDCLVPYGLALASCDIQISNPLQN